MLFTVAVRRLGLIGCTLLAGSNAAFGQTPVSTAITYQGRLKISSLPASDICDMQFRLFDAAALGNQVGPTLCEDGVAPIDGLFTVSLDFGLAAFEGNARWLEIGVRVNSAGGDCGTGSYTTLSTRQPMAATPYALFALNGPGGNELWETNGTAIHNTNDGNVGIGDHNPLAFLHVGPEHLALGPTDLHSEDVIIAGGDGVLGIYSDAAGGAGNGSAIAFGEIAANLIDKWGIFRDTNAAGGDLHISYGTNPDFAANTKFMTFDAATGNVGIGVSNPSAKLHVAGGRCFVEDNLDVGVQAGAPYKITAINETETAIFGKVEANSGAFGYGVYGQSDSANGGGGVFGIAPVHGVRGLAVGTTGSARGGEFTTNSTEGEGVFGYASADTGPNYGVRGRTDSPAGFGGYFEGRGYFSGNLGLSTTNPVAPLHVFAAPDVSPGGGGAIVIGSTTGANLGFDSNEIMARNNGVASDLFINHDGGDVLIGAGGGAGNVGLGTASPTRARIDIDVAGQRCIYGSNNSPTFATAFFDNTGTGPAGVFDGSVTVVGTLSKSGGSFRIDHPLDPANKYLYHSFVESPDMKNLYDGVVVTDARGYATIEMPEWFEPLNRDFRYQLTIIDAADGDEFVQAKIVREIADRKFAIRTSRGGVRVSWQVTGTRQDPWAEAHRIPVEQEKPAELRGTYQHPELFGVSREMGETAAIVRSSGESAKELER